MPEDGFKKLLTGAAKNLGIPLHYVLMRYDWTNATPIARQWAIRFMSEEVNVKVDDEILNFILSLAGSEVDAGVRRELASAAFRLAEKHNVTALIRALLSHKEDAKDAIIPQLVWIAYEKSISKKDGATTAEKELAWLAEQSPENPFVREQIVPKVMRRLVATGQANELKLCVEFIAKLKDKHISRKSTRRSGRGPGRPNRQRTRILG